VHKGGKAESRLRVSDVARHMHTHATSTEGPPSVFGVETSPTMLAGAVMWVGAAETTMAW